jgi:hypothetical protein
MQEEQKEHYIGGRRKEIKTPAASVMAIEIAAGNRRPHGSPSRTRPMRRRLRAENRRSHLRARNMRRCAKNRSPPELAAVFVLEFGLWCVGLKPIASRQSLGSFARSQRPGGMRRLPRAIAQGDGRGSRSGEGGCKLPLLRWRRNGMGLASESLWAACRNTKQERK